MAELIELKAAAREGTGKMADRALRAKKRFPRSFTAARPVRRWSRCNTRPCVSTIRPDISFRRSICSTWTARRSASSAEVQVDPVRDFPIHGIHAHQQVVATTWRYRSISSTRMPRPASSAAACSISSGTRSSAPARRNGIPESLTVDLTGPRRQRSHPLYQAPRGRHACDLRARLHHRRDCRLLRAEARSHG